MLPWQRDDLLTTKQRVTWLKVMYDTTCSPANNKCITQKNHRVVRVIDRGLFRQTNNYTLQNKIKVSPTSAMTTRLRNSTTNFQETQQNKAEAKYFPVPHTLILPFAVRSSLVLSSPPPTRQMLARRLLQYNISLPLNNKQIRWQLSFLSQ